MSPKNLQQSCTYCSGNHTKVSKCAQYRQDSVMAEYISDLDFTCKTKQNMLHLISKNILRLAVILFERGRRYNKDLHDSIVIVPSTQRSKPLSKFTKNQLIRRLVQLSKDFASQINTIVARKRQEAERQEAERQEAEKHNVHLHAVIHFVLLVSYGTYHLNCLGGIRLNDHVVEELLLR
jgi:hypothetical protein